MIRYLTLAMRVIVIAIIYFVIFRIIRIMYFDLKNFKRKDPSGVLSYALEVVDAPETLEIQKGSVYPVHTTTTIGRKDDNNIIINDPFVSGNHAKVFINNGKLYVKDLGSTNKTFRNGMKIEDTEEITVGDSIEIGRILFKVIG